MSEQTALRNDYSASEPPNPGSDAAVERGCTCPVLDNRHGAGAWEFEGEVHYWLAETCPLHGWTVREGER